MENTTGAGKSFSELTAVMARLRGEQGCPWDKEQTHASLKPFLLEETYELLDAIERADPKEMEEELGDLLHQILFHCQIASEQGHFSAEQVLSCLKEKLVRRHPHVFSDRNLPNSDAVLQHWVKAKAKERGTEKAASSLGELAKAMPALARAQRMGERASYFGFDWPGPHQMWGKIDEEYGELKEAVSSGNKGRVREEMGDLLFSLVNLCRFLGIEAEESLAQTVDRFLKRFAYIERQIREKGRTLAETSLEEMDSLWDEAKKKTTMSSGK
ncbi:MAG: nucleoside triphosphate pyrophosphohydrolase [Candidatus Binatia bacterium]